MGVLVPGRSRLECGRRRASARAGERPVQAAVVGFDWKGGGVTCERQRRLPARHVQIAPAARGCWPHIPWEAGAGEWAESALGPRDEEKSDFRRRPRPAG